MSKELKLLLISLTLLIGTVLIIYWNQTHECSTVEYQNLQGTHSQYICYEKKAKTCWDNYSTENQAIQACEGK